MYLINREKNYTQILCTLRKRERERINVELTNNERVLVSLILSLYFINLHTRHSRSIVPRGDRRADESPNTEKKTRHSLLAEYFCLSLIFKTTHTN